ncbi:unnamed protein product, partial [marine sediment metagenome]
MTEDDNSRFSLSGLIDALKDGAGKLTEPGPRDLMLATAAATIAALNAWDIRLQLMRIPAFITGAGVGDRPLLRALTGSSEGMTWSD